MSTDTKSKTIITEALPHTEGSTHKAAESKKFEIYLDAVKRHPDNPSHLYELSLMLLDRGKSADAFYLATKARRICRKTGNQTVSHEEFKSLQTTLQNSVGIFPPLHAPAPTPIIGHYSAPAPVH